MKKNKKTVVWVIVFTILLSLSAMAFLACGNGKKHYTLSAPEAEHVFIDAFDDHIDVQVTYMPYDDTPLLFMITPGGGQWEEANNEADRTSNPAPMFTHRFSGLSPNTEYIVSVKYKGNATNNDSEPYTQTVTTLKYVQAKPEATYTQANKSVTVEKNSRLEYSFDGGATFGDENIFTFAEKGEKIIKVRYKETTDKYKSDEQIINVYISDYYAGFGTADDPYLIASYDNFSALSGNEKGLYYKLVSDITFPATAVTPIVGLQYSYFDGNGYKLINPIISLNKRNEKCAVFKEIGAVKNLTVDNAKINYTPDDTGDYYVGIIAGSAQVLENCKVSGEITITHTGTYGATSYIGGAVGRMRSALGLDEYKVIDSYSDVKIRYYSVNKTSRSLYVGGLFGSDEESSNLDHKIEFSGCGANVDIELLGVSTVLVGGLIGYMTGDITNSYATGKIVVDGDGSTASNTVISIGGVVSNVNNGSITSCYAAMNLTANGDVQNVYIGGIARSAAGKKEQELKNCLFVGNIAITAGEDKLAMSNSLAVGLLPLYTVNNCYHSDNLVAPVVTEKTIAVAEATIKTAAWQQETLKFDPDVWNIEDGKYPTLK